MLNWLGCRLHALSVPSPLTSISFFPARYEAFYGRAVMSVSAVPVKNGEGGPPGQQGQVINLMNLQPQQLQQLKQQVEQELQFYQQAVVSLKEVQIRMQESGGCVKALKPDKSELLIPVTGSVRISHNRNI